MRAPGSALPEGLRRWLARRVLAVPWRVVERFRRRSRRAALAAPRGELARLLRRWRRAGARVSRALPRAWWAVLAVVAPALAGRWRPVAGAPGWWRRELGPPRPRPETPQEKAAAAVLEGQGLGEDLPALAPALVRLGAVHPAARIAVTARHAGGEDRLVREPPAGL